MASGGDSNKIKSAMTIVIKPNQQRRRTKRKAKKEKKERVSESRGLAWFETNKWTNKYTREILSMYENEETGDLLV